MKGGKKKGLSFDEKRERMMTIFTEDKSFFHYKDIEKKAIKKGIAFPSIKDVLESLVGDDMVEIEKCGNSSYYFSLPSKIINAKRTKLINNKTEIERLQTDNQNIYQTIKEQKKLRKETESYIRKKEQLEKLLIDNSALDNELKQYDLNDPVKFKIYNDDNRILETCFDILSDGIYICDKLIKTTGKKLTTLLPEEDYCELFEEDNIIIEEDDEKKEKEGEELDYECYNNESNYNENYIDNEGYEENKNKREVEDNDE
jgi:hypothetical protein